MVIYWTQMSMNVIRITENSIVEIIVVNDLIQIYLGIAMDLIIIGMFDSNILKIHYKIEINRLVLKYSTQI